MFILFSTSALNNTLLGVWYKYDYRHQYQQHVCQITSQPVAAILHEHTNQQQGSHHTDPQPQSPLFHILLAPKLILPNHQ